MPDPQGRYGVYIPGDEWEEYVLPTQRRLYEETGKVVTPGLVVRHLVKLGFAADSSQIASGLSSAAK